MVLKLVFDSQQPFPVVIELLMRTQFCWASQRVSKNVDFWNQNRFSDFDSELFSKLSLWFLSCDLVFGRWIAILQSIFLLLNKPNQSQLETPVSKRKSSLHGKLQTDIQFRTFCDVVQRQDKTTFWPNPCRNQDSVHAPRGCDYHRSSRKVWQHVEQSGSAPSWSHEPRAFYW